MASGLESLPAELLTQIASSLDLVDIAMLIQTSKKLYHHLESSLYRPQQARNDLLKWAITRGHLRIIRRLITDYESCPSAIRIAQPLDKTPRCLSLHLALRNKHLDVFKLLLELGARIPESHELYQLKAFVQRLFCSSTNHDFARAFLEAGRAAQLPRHLLDMSLMKLVRAKAPVDLVLRVLEQGAQINENHAIGIGPHKVWSNPLSASILCNSRPVFDLLLQMGASIHGTDVNNPRRMPLHIPIYAATYSMLEHGTAMVQACLDSGADINHLTVIPTRNLSNRYYYGTPLLGYLDSIKSWPAKIKPDGDDQPTPHIQYLLDRGAIVPDNLPAAPFPGPVGRFDDKTAPQLTVDLLLDKMKDKVGQLADPQFQAVTKLLIQRGALLSTSGGQKVVTERIQHLLSQYDHRPCPRHYPRYRDLIYPDSAVQAWRSFITLLLDNALVQDDNNANSHGRQRDVFNALLSEYIYARGTDLNDPPTDLTFEAISVLISHGGADINATATITPDTPSLPPLHRLCHYYHLVEFNHSGDGYRRLHDHDHTIILEQRRRLVSMLVRKCGADPDLRVRMDTVPGGEKGMTAEEILRRGWEEHYSDVGKTTIQVLVNEIRNARGARKNK